MGNLPKDAMELALAIAPIYCYPTEYPGIEHVAALIQSSFEAWLAREVWHYKVQSESEADDGHICPTCSAYWPKRDMSALRKTIASRQSVPSDLNESGEMILGGRNMQTALRQEQMKCIDAGEIVESAKED